MQCQFPLAEQEIPTQELKEPAFGLETSPTQAPKAEQLLATLLVKQRFQPSPRLVSLPVTSSCSGSLSEGSFPTTRGRGPLPIC